MVTRGSTEPELHELRRLCVRLQSRVTELEASQGQLELYAEDLQRTFRELRRQLSNMNELHKISTGIGSVLEPDEVMARTLDGLGRLVEHDVACVYLLENGHAILRALRGRASLAPPSKVTLGDGPLGRVLAQAETTSSEDSLTLTVPMWASGVHVGALQLVRHGGAALTEDERKLAELVTAEATAAIHNAQLYERTRRLATTDPQTGLFNYRYFRDALAMEVARARRLGYVVGLLMIDVDDFKRVNDTYGHPAGDQVLREVAAVLRRNLRRTDVLVRYGGEEFAIILPGLGRAGVQAVGEKLRRAVRALPLVEGQGDEALPVTISVGGMARSATVVDAVELVRDADAALYEAERRGKDCVFVAPAADASSAPTSAAAPLEEGGA